MLPLVLLYTKNKENFKNYLEAKKQHKALIKEKYINEEEELEEDVEEDDEERESVDRDSIDRDSIDRDSVGVYC